MQLPLSDLRFAFPALVAARLALAYSPLSDILRDDHLLSSPLTAYSRLQEGIYLFKQGIDPYAGGPFHHSPLYLTLFSTIIPTGRWVPPLLWTFSDAFGAWCMIRLWRLRQGVLRSSRDALVAAAYLLNPYIFLSTLSLSTATFENTLVLLTLLLAAEGTRSASKCMAALAFATHLSLPSGLLFLPSGLLLLSKPTSSLASPQLHPVLSDRVLRRCAVSVAGEYCLYMSVLIGAATVAAGGSNLNWMAQTWNLGFQLSDLTPNVGLWWYFFTEMFDHFRPFFLMVFSVHLVIYVLPLCIKFQHDPLYAAVLLLGATAALKPYPTLADPGLFVSLLALFPEVHPHLWHPLPTVLLHLHAALLLPVFHRLWLVQGTGNANFFYASTLVFGLANAAGLVDALRAGLLVGLGKGVVGSGDDKGRHDNDVEFVQM